MFKIPKQEYTAEFKERAAQRVLSGGEGVQAQSPGREGVTPEQMELSRVRAENARLRMEVEILKKATAYFAKDAL